jgi:hypothetical protein
VITYPVINGEVKLIKEHNKYVNELSNRRGWGDGEPYTKVRKSAMDIYLEAKSAKKSERVHRAYDFNEETKRGLHGDNEALNEADSYEDEDEEDLYYMADPRNINDLEEENIDLKEQTIHAMLTLE